MLHYEEELILNVTMSMLILMGEPPAEAGSIGWVQGSKEVSKQFAFPRLLQPCHHASYVTNTVLAFESPIDVAEQFFRVSECGFLDAS